MHDVHKGHISTTLAHLVYLGFISMLSFLLCLVLLSGSSLFLSEPKLGMCLPPAHAAQPVPILSAVTEAVLLADRD